MGTGLSRLVKVAVKQKRHNSKMIKEAICTKQVYASVQSTHSWCSESIYNISEETYTSLGEKENP